MGLAAVHCKAVVLSWFIVDFVVVDLNVWTLFCYTVHRQNKKNKFASGNRFENFRFDRYIYFFSGNIFYAFSKCIFFSENLKKSGFHQ